MGVEKSLDLGDPWTPGWFPAVPCFHSGLGRTSRNLSTVLRINKIIYVKYLAQSLAFIYSPDFVKCLPCAGLCSGTELMLWARTQSLFLCDCISSEGGMQALGVHTAETELIWTSRDGSSKDSSLNMQSEEWWAGTGRDAWATGSLGKGSKIGNTHPRGRENLCGWEWEWGGWRWVRQGWDHTELLQPH